MNLTCPNCKKEVAENDVKWFGGENGEASVFCCPTCYSIATQLYTRGRSELTALLNMLKESIRVSIADGRLHLPDTGELSKRAVLEAALQLKEHNDSRKLAALSKERTNGNGNPSTHVDDQAHTRQPTPTGLPVYRRSHR